MQEKSGRRKETTEPMKAVEEKKFCSHSSRLSLTQLGYMNKSHCTCGGKLKADLNSSCPENPGCMFVTGSGLIKDIILSE